MIKKIWRTLFPCIHPNYDRILMSKCCRDGDPVDAFYHWVEYVWKCPACGDYWIDFGVERKENWRWGD